MDSAPKEASVHWGSLFVQPCPVQRGPCAVGACIGWGAPIGQGDLSVINGVGSLWVTGDQDPSITGGEILDFHRGTGFLQCPHGNPHVLGLYTWYVQPSVTVRSPVQWGRLQNGGLL